MNMYDADATPTVSGRQYAQKGGHFHGRVRLNASQNLPNSENHARTLEKHRKRNPDITVNLIPYRHLA